MPLFLRDYTPLQRAKTLLRCSARKAVKYCDRECQSKDWKFQKRDALCALIRSDPIGLGDKMIASTQKNMQLEDYRVYALAILNQNQNEGLFSSIQSLKANTDSCVDEGACTLQLHIHGISISLTML